MYMRLCVFSCLCLRLRLRLALAIALALALAIALALAFALLSNSRRSCHPRILHFPTQHSVRSILHQASCLVLGASKSKSKPTPTPRSKT